jgi:hypothetical protein
MAFRLYGTRIEWLAEAERPRTGEILVIPANDHLWMLSGPGLEIKKTHGKQIELDAVRQGPVEAGSVVVTEGATLGYRSLYHAVVMGQDLAWIGEAGQRAMGRVVERALREKATELICFPFYRGVHGRREPPAREMLQGLFAAVAGSVSLKLVRFLFQDAQEKALLHETFLRLLAEPRPE